MSDRLLKVVKHSSDEELHKHQTLKYARELSHLFQAEKEKARKLGEANSNLQKLSQDLQTTFQELKEKEQLSLRLGRILDQTSNEIYILDSDSFQIQQANFGARKNLGYTLAELSQKTLYDLMPHYGKDEFEEIVEVLKVGKKPQLTFETTYQRKDGGTYPVEVRLQFSHAESVPLFVAVTLDISERKQALEEIDQLRRQLELENAYLREEVKSELAYGQIIGQSPSLQKTLQQIEMVAKTEASVLIFGESGTGKELVARAIHEQSRRNNHPMVKVNCAAIPRDLFESEFFGHVQGAFSGALKERTGRFQLADGGTLFLDEVSEIPLELQGKLLRVIQEGQFEPVGEDHTRQVDVRIIAATNRNLKEEVQQGRFREDLFFRLSVVPMEIPPLRERVGDIKFLADHFLERTCQKYNRKKTQFQIADHHQLESYHWPGNVRELQNVIERAVIISSEGKFRLDLAIFEPASFVKPELATASKSLPESSFLTDVDYKQFEQRKILAALEKSNWKVYGPRGAAEMLGMKPTTLLYRMKKMGIQKPR